MTNYQEQRCSTHKSNKLTQSDCKFLHLQNIYQTLKIAIRIKRKFYHFYCAILFFDMLNLFKTWAMLVFHNVLSHKSLAVFYISSPLYTLQMVSFLSLVSSLSVQGISAQFSCFLSLDILIVFLVAYSGLSWNFYYRSVEQHF